MKSVKIIIKTYKIAYVSFHQYLTEPLRGLCGTAGFHGTQFENHCPNTTRWFNP
jgi:hypothetical protein